MKKQMKKYRMYKTLYATVYVDVIAENEDEADELASLLVNAEDYCNKTVGAEADWDSYEDVDDTCKVEVLNVEGAEFDTCESWQVAEEEDYELEFEDEDEEEN